ncbi:hypothetical protein C5E22_22375 [Pectobacterium parmentieri]|uniref:Uncharacterized protein n=1 Tax=Pectobacterium parmentieri TaxID=1905730 RepID=A0A8B3FDQ0_PECPM|nr:hypothetical protein A8F97_19655 [Pectobacterium parmentieri]AYH12244.1 hypothetical protein C5E24_22495 [Pectobacterium parmentieri]AYH20960.1 hypothetical protein C5E22_22375 [Pectobacterium parmentieri]AYH38522.1 hypothetical protein C5E17_22220 [Pectobacterium parmentieri]AZS58749.1 hypothetical protein C5E18_22905 [Pectobacterium parmentieri]
MAEWISDNVVYIRTNNKQMREVSFHTILMMKKSTEGKVKSILQNKIISTKNHINKFSIL